MKQLSVVEYSAFKDRYPERHFESGNAGGVKAVREHSAIVVDRDEPPKNKWGYVVDYGWTVKLDHAFQLSPDNAAEYARLILQASAWCKQNP
jgi:hypothetical protein